MPPLPADADLDLYSGTETIEDRLGRRKRCPTKDNLRSGHKCWIISSVADPLVYAGGKARAHAME